MLCLLCFVSSAVITNDVALITFIPFTLSVLRKAEEKTIIFTVVMETVAANLGSVLTPVGNPQNLYIYKYYDMLPTEFFKLVTPLGILSFVLISVLLLLRKNRKLDLLVYESSYKLNKTSMIVFSILFVICLLTVFDLIPFYIMFPVVFLTTLVYDRKAFRTVDYNLLVTFVFFFIFVGNAGRVPMIRKLVSDVLNTNVLLVSTTVSQFISNVPAATMLSAFTKDASSLLLGVNIGGLGTIIASMASLISYRQICLTKKVNIKKYMFTFTVINFLILAVILGVYLLIL